MHVDSGYILPDPADDHRWMAVLYDQETDTVIVLRRCEEVVTAKAEEENPDDG